MKSLIITGCVALLAVARPLAAQQWDVTHHVYTLIDTELTIDVLTDAPGTLQLMHGRGGQVEVRGRALHGLAASAMGGNVGATLRLSAMGADRVEYMVVVPENTYVRVKLPDRKALETFSTTSGSASYTWQATGSGGAGGVARRQAADGAAGDASPGQAGPAGVASSPGSLFTTYADESAPDVVTFPSAAVFRSLTVRLEGNRFRVAASRPMTLQRGDPKAIAIRPVGPPMDVVLVVPAATEDFLVEVGGQPAMAVVRGRPMSMCTPVAEQLLEGGRLWY
ncbi:MAG TPA: hypothetical protein VJ957_06445, partial [Longimicrobiales bacterium]|nr:hypothetical protein [Longimicrobiales bacterium]